MKLIYFLWTLHIVLTPIYLFGSGTLQPSHAVMLTAMLFFFILSKKNAVTDSWVPAEIKTECDNRGRLVCTIFCLFALYVTIVNAFWSVTLNSLKPLFFSSFQYYNLLLIYFSFNLIRFNCLSFFRHTWAGFSGAIVLVFIAVFASGFNSASREEGLFNNPNQLAFFCVSSCLIFFISDRLSIGSPIWNRLMLVISCFLCLLTLSRAGLVACFIIFTFTMLGDVKQAGRVFLMIFFGLLLLATSYSIGFNERMQARNKQTSAVFDNQVEGRGYDRILANPEYLLLGAGEGLNKRFGGELASIGGELHSSVGTLIFCYGIIGFSLYSAIWYLMIAAGTGFAYKACAIAPILYGVTHNGLRFSAATIAIVFMIYGGFLHNKKIRQP